MAAAQKRPELASVFTTALPSVPQVYVNVDRDQVLQQGVKLQDVYQTMQCFMGGAFVNYFNRFGRQWQVYVQAEGDYRTQAENLGQFYVLNNTKQHGAAGRADQREATTVGPEFTMRYNLYQGAQINASAKPGVSSAQAMKAMEEVFKETMPPGMGFDYLGMSLPGKEGAAGRLAHGHLRVFAAVRVPDPRRAIRELEPAVQRPAGHAHRRLRRVRGLDGRPLRKQRLCPNRPGHAHRPGGQERHPHRRVRQDGLRAGQAAAWTPRSKAPSCGCGPF